MRAETNGHVSLSTDSGTATVALHGEIDLANVTQVDRCVSQGLAQRAVRLLVIDLAACTYLDSTGLGALVRAYERSQRGGCGFTVKHANGVTRRVIEATELDRVLPVED